MRDILIVSIIGYLFGCIQSSYILTKLIKKQDIRELGSGNAGASNVGIVYGKKAGIVVMILDMLKAIISMSIVKYLIAMQYIDDEYYLLLLNGLFIIIGHIYPFFINFKGGKGIASLVGILFGINVWCGLIGSIIFCTVCLWSNYYILGAYSINIYLICYSLYYNPDYRNTLITVAIFLVMIHANLQNIRKLLAGKLEKVRDLLFM